MPLVKQTGDYNLLLTESISWEISIIGLTLSIFTLINMATQSYHHRTDIILCCWLIILSIPLLHTLLEHANFTISLLRLYTNPALNLLQGPLLYCYVLLLISRKEKFRTHHFLHLLPFIFYYLLFILASYTQPMLPQPEQAIVPNNAINSSSSFIILFKPLLKGFGLINILLFLGYSILTIKTLLKHQKNITAFFSQRNTQISLKWIYLLPTTFFILVLLNLVNENSLVLSAKISPLSLQLLSYLSLIILLCFFGMKQRPVFTIEKSTVSDEQEEQQQVKLSPTTKSNIKAKKEGNKETPQTHDIIINEQPISEIIEKMHTYMRNKKPYLEPSFSVYDLATALDIPRRTLSYILSNGLSINFFQYVNNYRVEEVKRRLQGQQERRTTILDIAFESGFTSKSSFNSLFKQHCHVTPSQYRKMIKEKKAE